MTSHPVVDRLQRIAHLYHVRFDEESTRWKHDHRGQVSIPCARGCFGCCSMTPFCSLPEGIRAARTVGDEIAARILDEARQLSADSDGTRSLFEALKKRRKAGHFCSMLTNAVCSIYTDRPLACRALLSTRHPDWCTADFSALTPVERRLFIDSLDQEIVVFPTHYAAYPRMTAQKMEKELLGESRVTAGFSLYGPLPVMAYVGWLLREGEFPPQRDAIMERLTREGISPRLVTADGSSFRS